MNKQFLVVLIIGMMLFATIPAKAGEIIIKSVDPSPYYDSKPCVSGDYIVWRRAIDQNSNGKIELREPSWIMVHEISKGKTWNITKQNELLGENNVYHHAESPEICGGKVIYESQCSGNSWDTRLFMYNLSSGTTWEIPLKSTEYAHGHLHLIDGDWIAYTHKENGKRQAYILNYNDGNYRTIISKSDNYSVYGMVMWGNNVVITALNNSGGYEILVYGINSTIRKSIDIEFNHSKAIATTIYKNRVGISILEQIGNTTQWNTYIYDIQKQSLQKFQDQVYGVLLWGDQVVYEKDGLIHIQEEGKVTITISSIGRQYLGDIYNKQVVWMDNSNSENNFGDARDDWDIFLRKEVTPQEVISTNLVYIIIAIAIIVIGIIARRNGQEGMV